jgi:hypothetical protein
VARLLAEDLVAVLRVARPLEIAERADRARDEDLFPRNLARLPRELHAPLDDVGQPVVEILGGELAAVGAERVRLDELGAGPDEAEVDADDRLWRLQVRLLGAAQTRDGGGEQRARPPVRDEDGPGREALEETAHSR